MRKAVPAVAWLTLAAAALVAASIAWLPAAFANVPFYFAAATLKFSVWWAIPATLAIEAIVLKRLFRLGWGRAVVASLAANALTATVGMAAYFPLLAILYGAFASTVAEFATRPLQTALELLALLIVMAPVDTLLELIALRFAFRLTASRRQRIAFGLTNLLTVGLVLGAIAWDMRPPPPASPVDRARVEAVYSPEIAWMRELLQAWPEHARRDADSPRLTTDRDFAAARAAEARGLRFVAIQYVGPAGNYYPVTREVEQHRWEVVRRSTQGDVAFERWEVAVRGPLGFLRERPPPRFGYEIVSERPDGSWRVRALFEAEPLR